MDPMMEKDLSLARKLQAAEDRRGRQQSTPVSSGRPHPYSTQVGTRRTNDWGTAGGQRLGGDSGAAVGGSDGRQRALEAAEKRAASAPGVSQQKLAEMKERQQKEELIGKITEHYHRRSTDVPMGLNLASLEQLKQHWQAVQC